MSVVDAAEGAPPFPEVYRTHFRFVYRTLGRLGVREADLMDISQNVFVVVHRKLGGYEGRSSLTTWLFAICRLVVKDYLRSPRLRREVLVDSRELAARLGTDDGILRRLDSEDRGRVLAHVLDKLSEKLRIVFVLAELDGMSGEDIARLLGVPVGTVRSRLRLARVAFQRVAKALDGDDGAVRERPGPMAKRTRAGLLGF